MDVYSSDVSVSFSNLTSMCLWRIPFLKVDSLFSWVPSRTLLLPEVTWQGECPGLVIYFVEQNCCLCLQLTCSPLILAMSSVTWSASKIIWGCSPKLVWIHWTFGGVSAGLEGGGPSRRFKLKGVEPLVERYPFEIQGFDLIPLIFLCVAKKTQDTIFFV